MLDIIILIVSGALAYAGLSRTLTGIVHWTRPAPRFLREFYHPRRRSGRLSAWLYAIATVAALFTFGASLVRLFGPGPAFFPWAAGALCLVLCAAAGMGLILSRKIGTDQLESGIAEQWSLEKHVSREHDDEVDLFDAARHCNRAVPWLLWEALLLAACLPIYIWL